MGTKVTILYKNLANVLIQARMQTTGLVLCRGRSLPLVGILKFPTNMRKFQRIFRIQGKLETKNYRIFLFLVGPEGQVISNNEFYFVQT